MNWYQAQKRELPWRKSKNPYRIWVSEIMLQQTQVKTVIPYFQRWIKSFPSIRKLAEAPIEDVLKHWEGLGYYSRARNLHKGAQLVVEQYNGKVPDTREDILEIPGIGLYTAGAILSIAFEKRAPVLDGNVKRVLSRLFCLNENGSTSRSEKKLWDLAETILPEEQIGDFNQALMELGATVCLPQNPMCLLCPLQSHCRANLEKRQQEFPPPKKRTAAKKIEVSAAVILKNGKAYIQQRLQKGLMGGLWEFPGGKIEKGETPEACLVREVQEELGVAIEIKDKLLTIKHSYTQFRVTLHVFLCQWTEGRIRATQCEQWRWVALKKLPEFTYPAANVKIVNLLTKTDFLKTRNLHLKPK